MDSIVTEEAEKKGLKNVEDEDKGNYSSNYAGRGSKTLINSKQKEDKRKI